MKLYHAKPSPFVRKVLVCLHETGQAGDVDLHDVWITPLDTSQAPLAENPLGKIPALVRKDGPALYDSRVITRFLDARAGGKLYPAEPRLWETLTLEATADGILEAAVLIVYESRVRPEEIRSAPWVKAQWQKIVRALAAVEDRWMSHLNGPLDMAAISMGCALEYLDFRHSERDWRTACPALTAWQADFAKRESMQSTQPK